MMDDVLNAYGSRFLIAAGGVFLALAVLVVILWILKNRAPSPFVRGGRNRQPRLQVLDAAAVDARRRLVLVRRDNIEHLILIGGPTDVVVESGIGEPKAYLTGELAAQEALARSQALAQMQDLQKDQRTSALASHDVDRDPPMAAVPSASEAPAARAEIQSERREVQAPAVTPARQPVPVAPPAEAAMPASPAAPAVAAPEIASAERPAAPAGPQQQVGSAARPPSRPQSSPQAVSQPAPAARAVAERPAAQSVGQENRRAPEVTVQPAARPATPDIADRQASAAPEERDLATLNIPPQAPRPATSSTVSVSAPRKPETAAPAVAPVLDKATRTEVASPAPVSAAPPQAVPEIEPPGPAASTPAPNRGEAARHADPVEIPAPDSRAERFSNPAQPAASAAAPSPAGKSLPVESITATTPLEASALLDAARDRVLKPRVEPFSSERYKAPVPEDDIDLLPEPSTRSEPSTKPEPDIEALKSEFEKILDGEVLTQPSARPRPTVEPPVARAIPPMTVPPAARSHSAATNAEPAKPEGNLQDEIARIFGDMGAPRKD